MSLYLVALLALIACSVAVAFKPTWAIPLFWACFGALTAMLALRYGQGTDWLGYLKLNQQAPDVIDFSAPFYVSGNFHSEIGWKVLNNVWRTVGLDFFWLSFILAVGEMLLVYRFLVRFRAVTPVALLVAYPVVYLIWFFSSLRQGLVMAVFAGVLVPLLLDRKYVVYVAVCAFMALFHVIALALLVVPVVCAIVKTPRSIAIAMGVCVVGGVVSVFALRPLLVTFEYYMYIYATISWASIVRRLAVAAFVAGLAFANTKAGRELDEEVNLLLVIFFLGTGLYVALCGNSLIAGRVSALFTIVEIALIPRLIAALPKRAVIGCVLVVALVSAGMTVKNIQAEREQSFNAEGVTLLNFPYISVFNKDDLHLYSTGEYFEWYEQEYDVRD